MRIAVIEKPEAAPHWLSVQPPVINHVATIRYFVALAGVEPTLQEPKSCVLTITPKGFCSLPCQIILLCALKQPEVGHAILHFARTLVRLDFSVAPPTVHILASKD